MWQRMAERSRKRLPIDKLEHLIEDELVEEKLAELEAADDAREQVSRWQVGQHGR